MDKISLTCKAFQYLAALLGATELWGFTDAFQEETEEEIKQDIIYIKEELIEQNLADMNFDGIFEVNDEVNDMIRVCTSFDRYISVELRDRNQVAKSHLFFTKAGITLKLDAAGTGVIISRIGALDVIDEIMNLYPNPVWLNLEGEPFSISLRDLASIKKGKKIDQLIRKGCGREIAETLGEGLSGKGVLNTMVVLEREAGGITMCSHTLMFVPSGTLLLTITDDTATDDVRVEPVKGTTWRDQLAQALLLI